MKYLINDIGKHFSFPGVIILDTDELTERIREWNGWKHFNSAITQIVFPGNGANEVRCRLGEKWLSQWKIDSVAATRFWWPGVTPSAVVGQLMPLGAFDFETTDVVIVDDVVSSGATISKIRDRNAIWMPNARWHVAAWIKQHACRLRGFESSFFGAEVGEKNHRVPINSLSTLLENRDVAESYARRNFLNHAAFLAVLEELR